MTSGGRTSPDKGNRTERANRVPLLVVVKLDLAAEVVAMAERAKGMAR
jgi:hypothetical protein